MKKFRKYILALIAFCLIADLSAQAPTLAPPKMEIDLDDFIQKLAATQQDDVNYEDLYEALMQFYLNPLDLNKAEPDELRSLFVLSEAQIQDFYTHKTRFGNLLNLYELQSIESFDLYSIE
jgi:uncharacterized protein (DUF2267 family)